MFSYQSRLRPLQRLSPFQHCRRCGDGRACRDSAVATFSMETIMTYLVTGATGEIGSRIVEFLLQRGKRPRVFVRDARKARARFGERVDIAVGDLGDAGSLQVALAGIDAMFLVNNGPEIASRDELAAKAAKAAGVRHIVKLSSMDAQQEVGTGVWHALGEAAIRGSGITFTFEQPTGFMANALYWAASIKAGGVVRSATGDGSGCARTAIRKK
jgi:uncharacterized protein YbjT (DUF2867 family)